MKGIAEIILTDVDTGKVTRHVDENMFTNALNEAFNKAPWYFNNNLIFRESVNGTLNDLVPVIGKAIGGLLVFPQPIEENAGIIVAPSSNKPVGMASFDPYTGEDARRGNYNAVESGPVTGGYKMVFDFGTAQANGLISCIGLTTRRGANGYLDGGANLFQATCGGTSGVIGAFRSTTSKRRGFGGNDNGLFFYEGTTIYMIKCPKRKITLLNDAYTMTAIGTVSTNGTKLVVGNEIWIIRNSAGSTTTTLNIDKYNIDTWEKTTETISVNAPLAGSNSGYWTCVKDGRLYYVGSNMKDYYIINLSNPAEVIKCDGSTFGAMSDFSIASCAPYVRGVVTRDRLIEDDGTVHFIGDLNCHPIAGDGAWMVFQNSYIASTYSNVGASVFAPLLVTINNLGNAVTKTANQTMKVTYTVYEE